MTEHPQGKSRGESPFWRFSLRFYARPEVGPACIALQDESGADVNLLLFLLYLAEQNRQVTQADIARLDTAVRDWRERVVKPLRELRRALKSGIGEIPFEVSEGFRGQLKRLELESEQVEQHFLEKLGTEAEWTQASSRLMAAEANVAAYAAFLGGVGAQPKAAILAAFAAGPRHPV